MKALGYNLEGTQYCIDCVEKYIDEHFTTYEEFIDYVEVQGYPLFDNDIEEYGDTVLEEKCNVCDKHFYKH